MATKLLKPVTRECLARTQGGPMLVTLDAGDVIRFRRKGKRTAYEISLHNCEVLAVMQHMSAQHKAKVERWIAKGKRGRKPRAPRFDVFSPKLRTALTAKH